MLQLKLLPLLLAGPMAVRGCEADTVVIDQDDLTVVATGVRSHGGAVSVGSVHAKAPSGSPKIADVEVVYYRDVDGVPGYENPPDRYVDHRAVSLGTPSSSATVGSMSSSHAQNGVADSWSVRVEDENGEVTAASGSF